MKRSAVVSLRVEPGVKKDAEAMFSDLGLSLSDAVNVFLHKSLMVGGLPFEVKEERPNRETVMALQEARDIASGKKKVKTYSTPQEMFDDFDRRIAEEDAQ
jgi:DNA-damage-inducible protein J